MHEMSLVHRVVDIVLSECQGKEVTAVRAVHLTIGELSDVIEEYVEGLFQHFSRGTVAESAQVIINRVPATVLCGKCNNIFPVDINNEETWRCSRCGAYREYSLFSGKEFRVEQIDIECPSFETNDTDKKRFSADESGELKHEKVDFSK